MKAKKLFELACPAPAPTAPPKEKPGVAPGRERPGAPVRPSKRPNPFRRKDINPHEAPKPKANLGGYAYENKRKPSRARQIIESQNCE